MIRWSWKREASKSAGLHYPESNIVMKALYQDAGIRNTNELVVCEQIHTSDYHCDSHFHEEIEIMLVLSGGVHRTVGDAFTALEPGSLMIIGPNLPHQFSNRSPDGTPNSLMQAVSIKFNPALLGSWLQFTDAMQLHTFFRNAVYGLDVQGATRQKISEKVPNLLQTQALQRIILLLDILNDLSSNPQDLTPIASPGCALEAPAPVHQRLQRLTRYIKKHLSEPLYLKDAAQHIGMSPVTLSRFLRTHLRKTFPTYLNELRIARVCRLLRETDHSVSEIAAVCGFESMANFERQFRKLLHCSPKAYRRRIHSEINCKLPQPQQQVSARPAKSKLSYLPTKRIRAA